MIALIADTAEPPMDSHPIPVAPACLSRRPWEPLALLSILVLALALRWWELERSGWGAEYYTAAVRSMSMSWHNFFFVAFDPAGFISVDKPPVALWLQVLSVKLFGFHPVSVLLPQVLEGVAAVWVLYRLVRRQFSALPALLAALFMAITPVWVAVNRTNNTDSCLVLTLLLASWALLKAAETGHRRMLFLSMALVGLAFNVKMLAAFVVLPGFFLIYLIGMPRHWRRRLLDLAMASLVLAACALPWVLAYEATPTENRPYVGSSRHNSMLELVVGHNALGRFMIQAKIPARDESVAPLSPGTEPRTIANSRAETASRMRSELSRQFVQTPTGPLRLAGGLLGAQVEWLLPLALLALVGGAFEIRRREPPALRQLTMLFWLFWSVSYVAVYSAMGGIIHFYYMATLAPALAALAGIGIAGLWGRYRQQERFAVLLPLGLLLGAAWQLYLQAGALGWTLDTVIDPPEKWLGWLHIAPVGGSLAAASILIVVSVTGMARRAARMLAASALALGIAALLALPLAWSLSAVLAPGYGMLPSADLQRLIAASSTAETGGRSRFGLFTDTSTLVEFLKANRGDERFLLATSTTQLAASLIIATGEPVMARGGFHGLDPALGVDKLARMANEGKIRFVMLGDLPIVSRRMGADAAGKPIAEWVKSNGKLVDPALWRPSRGRNTMELYDLRPQAN
ncbi:MAG: glycosyltransferase family 39 protein [Proteobacteria bacterium]|nr:glycosyltransferase family 39 protein [Pseudomonadota bacterium]